MKCPKCNYLGFETSDRCRNCGYDFSLISHGDPQPFDLDLELRSAHTETAPPDWWMQAEAALPPVRGPRHPPSTLSANVSSDSLYGAGPTAKRDLRAADPPSPNVPNDRRPVSEPSSHRVSLQAGVPVHKPRVSGSSKLPLFTPADKGDEPLIRLPVTPRPPLAVRRTPDSPRLQVVSRAVRAVERDPALEFETARAASPRDDVASVAPSSVPRASTQGSHEVRAEVLIALSGPLTRMVAAVIDHVLLLAIDAGVIYFTLRIAGLSMDEWNALPVLPLVSFLLLLKLAYFCAFTAVGGQTIGKMALRIRVVSEDNGAIDATLALRRTVVGAVSTAFLGLGMLPAFFDPDRRAFHDRVARTRVVGLRTA